MSQVFRGKSFTVLYGGSDGGFYETNLLQGGGVQELRPEKIQMLLQIFHNAVIFEMVRNTRFNAEIQQSFARFLLKNGKWVLALLNQKLFTKYFLTT